MFRYMVKTFKPPPKQDLEKHSNLTSEHNITLTIFNFQQNLYPWNKEKARDLIEEQLKKGMYINPKYDLKRKENVRVFHSDGKVFEEKVLLPKKAVTLSKKLEEKRYVESFSDKRH
ncbi:MAG: hypothetical protein ABEJ98_00755 [Candidatus Nanohaloarchaea archaeon]